MHRLIKTIIGTGLLVLSGNVYAIIFNDHIYGQSGYSLDDIDLAIQAFHDDATTRSDMRHLKNARIIDRRVEELITLLDLAKTTGKNNKPGNHNLKQIRQDEWLFKREARLLAILAAYLPGIGGILPDNDIPSPLLTGLLPDIDDIIQSAGNPANNGNPSFDDNQPVGEATPVPEPSMLALLCLCFPALLFAGRIQRR